jgi:hypothetical protein
MGIEIPPRNKSGRKTTPKPRGPVGLWVRHRDHVDAMRKRDRDDWSDFLRVGRPEFGTVVGKLFNSGHFDQHHCAAARIFAEIVGRNDRYHPAKDARLQGVPRSPSYERGFGGGDDEVERRIQDGSIVAYERKARRAQRAMKKLDDVIVNEVARSVLFNVCICDLNPSSDQIHDLKAQLDLIWDAFKHRYEKTDDGKIRTWIKSPETRDHPFLGNDQGEVAGTGESAEGSGEQAAELVE